MIALTRLKASASLDQGGLVQPQSQSFKTNIMGDCRSQVTSCKDVAKFNTGIYTCFETLLGVMAYLISSPQREIPCNPSRVSKLNEPPSEGKDPFDGVPIASGSSESALISPLPS